MMLLDKNATRPVCGLYIHIPWCIQKCPYCDFNSHAVKESLPEKRYIQALLADLQQDLALLSEKPVIPTIFIGGGTPSLLSPESLADLLNGVRQQVRLTDDVEITLEANPGTFESQKFNEFRQLGINRLSIGIQSFQDVYLKRLGRVHSAREAKMAVEIAKTAGFERLNLDLMFSLPEQTGTQAVADVETAISLAPSHVSLYQLTLEPNTLFYRYPPVLPDDEATYAMQQHCQERLAAHGYEQYEVSAYAKDKDVCRHNVNYWQFGDYLGIGAGAHGKISQTRPENIIRTVKYKNPQQYLQGAYLSSQTVIAPAELPLEFLMNQLRLKHGFLLADYETRTGLSKTSLEPALSRCLEQGLLSQTGSEIRCSAKGWDFLDKILAEFVPV